MCRATAALRRLLGIRDYRPGPTPKARVRKPTRFGARGAVLMVSSCPLVEELAREQRLIRQSVADAERRRTRGRG